MGAGYAQCGNQLFEGGCWGNPWGVRVLPSVSCRNQKGLRNDLEALFNSTASKGGMNRTDCKPRANNRHFRGEKQE